MAPGTAMAGPYTYEEMTLRRRLLHGADSGLYQFCLDRVGSRVAISEQPLDGNGRAGFHRPTAYGGVLTGVTEADYDADGNDPDVLELTVMPDAMA